MFLTYLKNNHAATYAAIDFHRADVLEGPIDFVILESIVIAIWGEVTQKSYAVDRLWSFLPTLTTAYFAFLPLFPWAPSDLQVASLSDRALLLFGLQCLWSWRLTYNTWRRGLFNSDEEDYRWALLREHLPGILYKIFNVVFIAFTQLFLLFSLGLPAYFTILQPRGPLVTSDYILAGIAVGTLLLEFTSDNTQWVYQNYKHSGGKRDPSPWPFSDWNWTKADADRGFVAEGLWSLSRHPNFLCEQMFWVWMSLFPIAAEPKTISTTPITFVPYLPETWHLSRLAAHPDTTAWWHMGPAMALSLLFISSTLFTEYVTAQKYPSYKTYRRRVGMFSPISTLWSLLYLNLTGEKTKVDAAIWGGRHAKGIAKGYSNTKQE
ncbi:hypothetical protein FRB97_001136 [Tulasnella sp. 331]|nr:hypothetical protein FRB97_001136 [Tulasnella sp. 331]